MPQTRTITDAVRDFCGLTSDFNTEVDEMIAECKADLERIGVDHAFISDTDPSIITCCKLYAAYMRDISGKGETYRANYELLRDALSLNDDYTGGDANDE